jgi:hypothetical protein
MGISGHELAPIDPQGIVAIAQGDLIDGAIGVGK